MVSSIVTQVVSPCRLRIAFRIPNHQKKLLIRQKCDPHDMVNDDDVPLISAEVYFSAHHTVHSLTVPKRRIPISHPSHYVVLSRAAGATGKVLPVVLGTVYSC